MFEVSRSKKEILEKLVEKDWTPTDLAEELGKSTSSVYNHLDELAEQGILTKKQVEAKTRPKTEYSIQDGFIQYLSILPGQVNERTLSLDESKEPIVRIWNIPQEEFHQYITNYWHRLRNTADLDFEKDVTAVAVYGSVARGEADQDSDIDVLLVIETGKIESTPNQNFGTFRIKTSEGSKIAVTETFSKRDFRNSIVHGSSFLQNIWNELHILYDPERILTQHFEAVQKITEEKLPVAEIDE